MGFDEGTNENKFDNNFNKKLFIFVLVTRLAIIAAIMFLNIYNVYRITYGILTELTKSEKALTVIAVAIGYLAVAIDGAEIAIAYYKYIKEPKKITKSGISIDIENGKITNIDEIKNDPIISELINSLKETIKTENEENNDTTNNDSDILDQV